MGGECPPDTHTGSEHLGNGAQVDDPFRRPGVDGGQRVGVEAQQPVGVVLQDEDVLAHADLCDAGAAFQGQGDARGVLVVGDGVEKLHRSSGLLQVADGGFQRLGDETVGVHVDVNDVGLACAETSECAHIGGGFRQDDVSGVDEELGHEVEGLLGAGGDDDVVRVGVDDAVVGHNLRKLLTQRFPALAGTVLERLGTAAQNEVSRGFRQRFQRQVFEVGHAAGQRDNLGA